MIRKIRIFGLWLFAALAASCGGEEPAAENALTRVSITVSPGNPVGGTEEGVIGERYINDVVIYLFRYGTDGVDGTLIEQMQNPVLGGADGEARRTVTGVLRHSGYNAEGQVQVVMLTNLQARGVVAPTLAPGISTQEDLYNALAYDYAPDAANTAEADARWRFPESPKRYIPMWGMGTIAGIEDGKMNVYTDVIASLHRALARVDVVFRYPGCESFVPESVTLIRAAGQGYCAPFAVLSGNGIYHPDEVASVPEGVAHVVEVPFHRAETELAADNTPLSATWRLYVPETANTLSAGQPGDGDVLVTLKGKLNGTTDKTYTLAFRKSGEAVPHSLLRNHLYRFNITKINGEVNVELKYEVERWDAITVTVTFN